MRNDYETLELTRRDDHIRKWRETLTYQTAPISTNLIPTYVGQHVLGLPRSY